VAATGIFQRLSAGSDAFSVALMGIVTGGALAALSLYLACELLDPGMSGAPLGADVPFFLGATEFAVSFMGRNSSVHAQDASGTSYHIPMIEGDGFTPVVEWLRRAVPLCGACCA
jgi:hypothetical protein